MLGSKTTDELIVYFSRMANNICFRPETAAEELISDTDMEALDAHWIRILADINYRTDGRNELAALTARKLAAVPVVQEMIRNNSENEKMQTVAEGMALDHRTIQQSFSRLVFYHLYLAVPVEAKKELVKTAGEEFWYLPMI